MVVEMALDTQRKQQIIHEYDASGKDTGSCEVQIALLNASILDLQGHFEKHGKDHHSRVGLIRKINQRRKLLSYLNRKDPQRYTRLIKKLGLRR